MTIPRAYFQDEDLSEELPAPGYYPSSISQACFRRSSHGNRMLQVVHELDGVGAAHARIADYFALEGENPSGVRWARRRLVQLYRAIGLDPKQGEKISPTDLIEARLQVEVEHDERESPSRLRIVGYRPFWPTEHKDNLSF
jgi:hypothetical protein